MASLWCRFSNMRMIHELNVHFEHGATTGGHKRGSELCFPFTVQCMNISKRFKVIQTDWVNGKEFVEISKRFPTFHLFSNCNFNTGMPSNKAVCCSAKAVFNPSYQLCCEGNVFGMESKHGSKCCGSVMYNTSEAVCCDLKVGADLVTAAASFASVFIVFGRYFRQHFHSVQHFWVKVIVTGRVAIYWTSKLLREAKGMRSF